MEIIMRNLCFLLTLVATLLLPGRLIAAALPQDEKLITGQLDNGLRYMIYPHAQPKDQVNLWLQIHTGSLQEEDNERGVAHFVEHMMFNGTKTWPGNKVIETFESMGLRFGRDVNAYTSYDETVYQVSLPTTQKQNLQQVMAIFSEWSNAATFEKLEVDAERGVVTEEWRAHQDAKWRTSQARRPFLLANTRNLDREPRVEFYSKGVHVRNVAVTVNSNGAEATGDVIQRGNWRDISCSFSFTDTNQMHKLKVSRGRMKFHKMTDEAKQAKRERKEARKAERQAKRDAKKAEKAAKKAEKSKKKSFLFF